MAEHPGESVARTGKRVDYQGPGCEWNGLGNGGDVSPDIVGQLISGTFHRGSPENPYPSAVPIGRPQAVNANVVGITPAFDPISLHLRQVEYGIPLCALQQ